MNFLEELKREHNDMADILFQLQQISDEIERGLLSGDSASAAVRSSAGLVEWLIVRMTRHEEREEKFLFPALRKWVPQAASALNEAQREHERLDQVLLESRSKLQNLPTYPARLFLAFVKLFTETLRGHIVREEKELYPMAQNALSPQELEGLAQESEASEAPEFVDIGGGD